METLQSLVAKNKNSYPSLRMINKTLEFYLESKCGIRKQQVCFFIIPLNVKGMSAKILCFLARFRRVLSVSNQLKYDRTSY